MHKLPIIMRDSRTQVSHTTDNPKDTHTHLWLVNGVIDLVVDKLAGLHVKAGVEEGAVAKTLVRVDLDDPARQTAGEGGKGGREGGRGREIGREGRGREGEEGEPVFTHESNLPNCV